MRQHARTTPHSTNGRLAVLLATTLLLGLLPFAAPAFASSVTAASFEGGKGTFSSGGTLYAKSGGALTLKVTTSSDTKCVTVTGAHASTATADKAKTAWSFVFSAGLGDGTQTVSLSAYDNTGCSGVNPGTGSASYVLDNTGPLVTAALSPLANAAGWNKNDVSVTWSATDAGSGLDKGPTPTTASVTTNTAGQLLTSSASDKLGNSGTGSVTVKLDKGVPTITGARSPAAGNSNGWNNQDVTVSFTCADSLSGIKGCSSATTLSSDGANQAVTGTATDSADNSASATVSGINIDKVPPTITGVPTASANDEGWYRNDVTIAWTCADQAGLSGLSGTCPTNSTITGEGSALTATASISDRAGNSSGTTHSTAVDIDRTAPVTSLTSSAWMNATSLELNPTDNLSGVQATHYQINGGSVQSGTTVPLADEGDYTITFWSEDKAGNVETTRTVDLKVDRTAPTVTPRYDPAANLLGWHSAPLTVHFNCADAPSSGGAAPSGIATCTASQDVSSEGKGQTFRGTAKDNAGNTGSATATVNLDLTRPTISGSADRGPNTNGWYNDEVTVSFSCDDALSGVTSCTDPVPLVHGGGQQASGTVRDAAGHTASATVSGIDIDEVAPTLEGAATTSPNGNGWYNGDVSIAWTCSDALSGLDGACPANSTVTGEGNPLSASGSVSDLAGNTKNTTVRGIKIDRTAPTTAISLPTAPGSGWYTSAIDIELTATDALSGIGTTYYKVGSGDRQTYTGPFQFSNSGISTITFWSVDKADNVEQVGSATVTIDAIKPTVTISGADNEWHNAAVTLSVGLSDDGSGADAATLSCKDGSELLPITAGQITVSTEGTRAITCTGNDFAGNEGSARATVKIDDTPPTVTITGDETDLHNANVTLDVTIDDEDGGSGEDASTLACKDGTADLVIVNGEVTVSTEGTHSVTCSGEDVAGNLGTDAATVKIDKTAPKAAITGQSIAGGTAEFSFSSNDSTATFVCALDDAALAPCGSPKSYTGLSNGSHTFKVKAVDLATNSSEATKTFSVDTGSTTQTDAAAETLGEDGGTVSTGTTTTSFDPVAVSITTSTAGEVTIEEVATPTKTVTGYNLFGQEIVIHAPDQTAADPLQLTFSVHSSLLPSGATASTVDIFRNGIRVASCDPLSVGAVPDPCVKSKTIDGTGNFTALVLTSKASTWNTGMAALKVGPVLSPLSPATSPSDVTRQAFKIKSVIPVKFRLYLDQAMTQLVTTPPAGNYAKITVFKYNSGTAAPDSTDVVSAGSANTDGLFRWTGAPDHQYIYNLGTANRTEGTFAVQLTLFGADGATLAQSQLYYFILRK